MANKPIQIDYGAMGIWLRTSPELRAHLETLGKEGVAYAEGIAPVGTEPKDKHPGAYRDSLNYAIHQGKTRMSLRIGARDAKAHWIEYGAKHMPKFAVLRYTLSYLWGRMG